VPDFLQVQAVSTVARQAVFSGQGPVLLENRSLNETVYLGTDEGMDPGGSDIGLIDPLGTKAFDGSGDVWVRMADGVTGFALVIANPGGTESQVSPALIVEQIATAGLATAANQASQTVAINAPTYGPATLAQQVTQQTQIPAGMLHASEGVTTEIAALIATGSPAGTPGGVPLLTNSQVVANAAAIAFSTGTQTFGPYAIDQPGYDVAIDVTSTIVGLAGISVTMQWNDSVSGALMATEEWDLLPGPLSANVVIGKGPTKGNQLTIRMVLTAGGPATIAGNMTVLQNSRVYTRDDWRMIATNAATGGFVTASPNIYAGLLGSAHPNLATGAADTYVLPLFAGRVELYVATTSNTDDAFLTVQNVANPPPSPQMLSLSTVVGQTGGNPQIVILPKAQCTVTIRNENAGNQTVTWACVLLDDY
jgi:hypothetical protein